MHTLLERKTAVVTGGGSGIGQATANLMAREGASVAILDTGEETGRRTANELTAQGRDAAFFAVDVTSEEQVRAAILQIIGRFGHIDILHNNAGIAVRHPVAEQDEQGWQTCMDVNLKGIFLCAKHVIPHMLDREAASSILRPSQELSAFGIARSIPPRKARWLRSQGIWRSITPGIKFESTAFALGSCAHPWPTPCCRTQSKRSD